MPHAFWCGLGSAAVCGNAGLPDRKNNLSATSSLVRLIPLPDEQAGAFDGIECRSLDDDLCIFDDDSVLVAGAKVFVEF